MAQRLHDIQPGEVSLVRRGANRRRFLLAKSDELDVDVADILEAPVAREADLLDLVRKSGGDESVEKAAATVARSLVALRDAYGDIGMPDELRKATAALMDCDEDEPADAEETDETLEKADADREHEIYKRDFTAGQRRQLASKGHALPNGSYPIESKADLGPALTLARSGHGDAAAAKSLITRRAKELGATDQLPDNWDVSKEEDRMSETAQAVPVKKDDGSWDLSAVPEEQRPTLELVLKAHDDEVAELRKQAETEKTTATEALAIAKAEQEGRLTREFIAKAETLDKLSQEPAEFGPVLRDIAKAESDGHVPEGTLEKLETVLAAANEAVSKGALFTEIGRVGEPTATDGQAKVEGIAKALREANPDLTKEQAFTKALEQNPALYVEMQKESV